MEPLYRPEGVEERWQRTWEEEGLYAAEPDPTRERFVVAHPPPNVTGELHMGHALQLALADTLVRWQRMQGKNALFQPGYDHAGISTQNDELAARFDPVMGGRRLANYLRVLTLETQTLARANGKSHVNNLEPEDLVALTIEAAAMAKVPLAGTDWIPGHGKF